jgi:hypothetical protein
MDSDVIANFTKRIFYKYSKQIWVYFISRVFEEAARDTNVTQMFPLKLDIWKEEKMFISLPTPNSVEERKIEKWPAEQKEQLIKIHR